MNNLKNTECYLAGNLENTDDAVSWRENATTVLKELGIVSLNPRIQCFTNQLNEDQESADFLKGLLAKGEHHTVKDFMQKIIRRDLRMVDRADFIIVNLEPKLPTYGTTHEIVVASLQRKPILLRMDDKSKLPLWYCGLLDMSLVFEKWDDLYHYIRYVNDCNPQELDGKYWKIWSDEYK